MDLYEGRRTDEDKLIQCPKELCPWPCNESCPLWAAHIARRIEQAGRGETAVAYLRRQIQISPEEPALWLNLGDMLWRTGRMQEACDTAVWACRLDRKVREAYICAWGMCQDLHLWDGARHYARAVPDRDIADSLLAQTDEAEAKGGEPVLTVMPLLNLFIGWCVKDDVRLLTGDDYFMPPALAVVAHDVCRRLYDELMEHGKSEHVDARPDVWLAWAAYAGIGAVWHWKHDEPELLARGVASTLVEARGVFYMDEYVLSLMGTPFGTPEARAFEREMRYGLASNVAGTFKASGLGSDMAATLEVMAAMYLLGLAIGTNRFGGK